MVVMFVPMIEVLPSEANLRSSRCAAPVLSLSISFGLLVYLCSTLCRRRTRTIQRSPFFLFYNFFFAFPYNGKDNSQPVPGCRDWLAYRIRGLLLTTMPFRSAFSIPNKPMSFVCLPCCDILSMVASMWRQLHPKGIAVQFCRDAVKTVSITLGVRMRQLEEIQDLCLQLGRSRFNDSWEGDSHLRLRYSLYGIFFSATKDC
jgi:hypothetical protein